MNGAEVAEFRSAIRRAGRAPMARLGKAVRAVLASFALEGITTPIGDGDAKTNAPGTYRPVGPSCPSSCPFLPATEAGRDSIDWEYVEALATLAQALGLGSEVVAWTYTHEPDPAEVERLRVALPWLSIRHSDHRGPMGAVVAEVADIPALRRAGLKPLHCPATRKDVDGYALTDCQRCKACWEQPNRLIVFPPHGSGTKKLRQRRAGEKENGSGVSPCYAANGNVGIHSRRSTVDPWASARAAMAAVVWARATNRLARLHVSGGFYG